MFMKPYFICILLPLIVGFTQSESGRIYSLKEEYCISKEEKQLYTLINEYRKKQRLPPVNLSASLSKVARIHSTDLQENLPHMRDGCNLHSWSDKGDWKSCCYTLDHKKASCMWDKPRELTNYKGDGYEISYGNADPADTDFFLDPSKALGAWKSSRSHNEVIVNKGIWKQVKWQAMGVGIYKGYATVWFGKETDVLPRPQVCP